MTDMLRNQITEKGLSANLINNIIDYAETFKNANVSQKGLLSTKEISEEIVDVFSATYDEIIGRYKNVSGYYQYDVVKKEQFTFSKSHQQFRISSKNYVRTSHSRSSSGLNNQLFNKINSCTELTFAREFFVFRK